MYYIEYIILQPTPDKSLTAQYHLIPNMETWKTMQHIIENRAATK